MSMKILHGDCIEEMRKLPANSVDSVVTDPPYGIGFMGRAWDGKDIVDRLNSRRAAASTDASAGPNGAHKSAAAQAGLYDLSPTAMRAFQAFSADWAREAFRVLKPGGHLISFASTRTYHRMVCGIEEAGFEIRDCIRSLNGDDGRDHYPAWVFGSGFPKSLDVSKAIDKAAGVQREVLRARSYELRNEGGYSGGLNTTKPRSETCEISAPATDAAQQWEGWGTALKPAHEPVVLAQKPEEEQTQWVTMAKSIQGLWSDLWLMQLASNAGQFSELSPAVSGVDPRAFAQCSAEVRRSTRDALCAQMGMSQFEMALTSCLSTVKSWSDTLAASWNRGSTSTTETKSSTTTELRTLKFCLSAITLKSIILAHRTGQWSSANACNAARVLNATVATLNATRELSVLASAIEQDQRSCQEEAGRPPVELIALARKPLAGTVAGNVLEHGTGGLNIDGCRVETADDLNGGAYAVKGGRTVSGSLSASGMNVPGKTVGHEFVQPLGRWPANVLHDGSPEVVDQFPISAGAQSPVKGTEPTGNGFSGSVYGEPGKASRSLNDRCDGGGSAARFFWCPKASPADRHAGLKHPGPQFERGSTLRDAENLPKTGNHHPTVKPTELMRYLCRLVTPPGGTVLDPFMGSGSTLKAAELEGFSAIGIELDAAYIAIARRRIAADAPLFAEIE